jgi:rhodanese-related sulfurtransferase
VAGILMEEGLKNLSALKGGWGAWRKAEYPVAMK